MFAATPQKNRIGGKAHCRFWRHGTRGGALGRPLAMSENAVKKRTWELLRPQQQHRVADAVLGHSGRLGDGAHRKYFLRGEHVQGALEARRYVWKDDAGLALEAWQWNRTPPRAKRLFEIGVTTDRQQPVTIHNYQVHILGG